jgi:Fe-S-cluster containining protein
MASTDSAISLASRLCLACGMCCNGTVYDDARLEAEEVPAAAAAGFSTCQPATGGVGFALPCHYLDGKACTIYEQWRPDVCSSYFCSLQERAASGECTEAEALELIATTLGLRQRVVSVMRPGETFRQARARFDTLATAGAALSSEDAALAVRMLVLERMLDQHFRKPGEERVRAPAEASEAVAAVSRP